MRTWHHAASTFALLLAVDAHAGGWIGGGTGELIGDSANPWFLDIPEQAAKVSYCIEADESAMGVALPDLAEIVQNALAYWRVQIASAHLPGPGGVKVRIKTEPFEYTRRPCDDTTDLAFQFGKVSTAEQRRFIETEKIGLTRYVGFAARLAYDETLRGRGFVYIAPESGPLRPQGENLLERMWSDGGRDRLAVVVTHELGHVFGVAHFGRGTDLMGRDFPERVVSNSSLGSHFLSALVPLFRAGDATRFSHCYVHGIPSVLRQAFHLSERDQCLMLRLDGDGMQALAAEDDDLSWRSVARFRFDGRTFRERYHEVVRLWLPERRTVFRQVPSYMKILSGPAVVEMMVSGTLTSAHGVSMPAMLTIDPLNFQISVTLSGVMVGDLLEGMSSGWLPPSR